MKAVDYSKMTVDELVVMDKVDICQVIKYFKEDLINLDSRFTKFKGYPRQLIVGQWVVFMDYKVMDYGLDTYVISRTEKISTLLANECCYTPQEINGFLDNLKKDRIKFKRGYRLVIDDNFGAYNENRNTFSDSLSGSCMNGYASRYYDLLSCLENPDDLQICTVWDCDDKLIARTLIWKGGYYDRIYANSSAIIEYVKSTLKERGYDSVYYEPMYDVEVALSTYLEDYSVPYMDSVCYYRKSPLQISTYSDGDTICLQEVDGVSCFDLEVCACCDNDTSSNNGYYIARRDVHICSCCTDEIVYAVDTDQYEYIIDCVRPVDTSGDWYYDTDDLYYAVDTEEWYAYNDELAYTEDTGDYYRYVDDLYYAVDTGEWYLYNDNLSFTVDTEEWYGYDDELYYVVDTGEYYKNKDGLYYTVDTEEYYKYNNELHYDEDIKEWYKYNAVDTEEKDKDTIKEIK